MAFFSRAKLFSYSSISIWLILAVFLSITTTEHAAAATFNKNKLIDDSLFINHDSMSVVQIQSFLDSKGSLLANWVDDVDMRRPSDNCIVHHATNMTAAEIIYESATTWGTQVYDAGGCAIENAYWSDPGYSNYSLETVSPKDLLVLLEKEQSLISADGTYSSDPEDYKDPSCCASNEYKLARATGYGVPDSGSINEKYLGFYNQINWASWQLRYNFERAGGNTSWDEVSYLTYTGPMIEGSFRRCGTCSVEAFDGYYPIDGSPLYMDNRATASLYFYTPHTYPGFFGNYNFVQFYTNWFGSTSADAYSYSYHSQTANPAMKQGFGADVYLRYKNAGSEDWYDKSGLALAPSGTLAIKIAADNPYAHRDSEFNARWLTTNTPADEFNKVYEADGITLAANQDMATPGQVVEFKIRMHSHADSPTGDYQEFFTLVRNGSGGGRILGGFVWTRPRIVESVYSASFAGQKSPAPIFDDSEESVYVRYKNTGNVDWFDITATPPEVNTISLSTYAPLNRSSELNRTWPSSNRPTGREFSSVYESDGTTLASNQDKVKPGQIVEFAFDFAGKKRTVSGTYKEHFKLVREGWSSPLFGPTTWLYANYDTGTFMSQYLNQAGNPTIAPGGSSTHFIRYKNAGTATWFDSISVPLGMAPIGIATTNSLNRASDFSGSWASPNRPTREFAAVYEADAITLAANQNTVEPGQIAEISFDYSAPIDMPLDVYREDFFLFRSGAANYSFNSNTRFWSYIRVQ